MRIRTFTRNFIIMFLLFTVTTVKTEAAEISPIRIPVLIYHHISDEVNNPMVVSEDKFIKDIKTLKGAGYETIFLTELYEYLKDNATLPGKPVIITFDDGYSSFYDIAYPIAKETNTKLTVSIIGWSVGRNTMMDNKTPITPHFSWKQAKEMIDSGLIDIQNHTYDLHSTEGYSVGFNKPTAKGVLKLKGENEYKYRKRLRDDLITLNHLTYCYTGYTPTFLVYPYGKYSDLTEKIVYDIGFTGSLTSDEGIREYKTVNDLKKMPRINVTNDLKGDKLLNKIEKAKLK